MDGPRHRSRWLWLAAGGLLLSAVARPAIAPAAVIPLTFPDLVLRSKLVLTGEVVGLRSYRAPFHDLGEVIFTDVTIRVEGMLKGPLDTKDVTVQILGGEIGTAFQRCPESPRFERGEKVLVFLRDYHGALWTTGWLQGKYALSREGLSVKGVEGLPVPRDVTLEALKAEVRVWTAPTAAPPAGGSTPVLRKAERATKEGGSR